MSKNCVACGKHTVSGNAVSHSNVKVRRTWEANLQKVRILEDGVARRAYVCTRCLKSGKVTRAV